MPKPALVPRPIAQEPLQFSEPKDSEKALKTALRTESGSGILSTLLSSERELEEVTTDFRIRVATRRGTSQITAYTAYADYAAGSFEEIADNEDWGVFDSYFTDSIRSVAVLPHNFKHFDGFEEYTGTGLVTYVHKLEALSPGTGHGRALLQDLLLDRDRELTFLHAINADAAAFFIDQGFVHSGIVSGSNVGGSFQEPVLVYYNQQYRRPR
jgi:hypothetical protein